MVTPFSLPPSLLGDRVADMADVYELDEAVVGPVAWRPLPYGTTRALLVHPRRGRGPRVATVCDGVHHDGAHNYRTVATLEDAMAAISALPRPALPVFSAARRAIRFPKRVQMALLRGMVLNTVKVAATDVLWPPLFRAFRELSGGDWREADGALTVDFFGGGYVAAYFVRKRLGVLTRGQLKVAVATAADHLDALFKGWARRVIAGNAAAKIRAGDLSDVPAKRRRMFDGFARERLKLVGESGQPPPRCVRSALAMAPVGRPGEQRAWRNEHRWDMARIVKRYAMLIKVDLETVLAHVEAAMKARGDCDKAIKEFRGQVRHAKPTAFRCAWRRKQKGIFCVYDCAADCAAERGASTTLDPETMDPALVWATKQSLL
jgi:hypothetical protein